LSTVQKRLIETIDVGREEMPGTSGVFAQCYRAGNLVFMSGQTAFTLDGELVGVGDPAAQTRQACDNIRRLMEQAGGTINDVVRMVVYVTNREYRHQVYPELRTAFGEVCPCSTGLVVDGLARPELLVEIDAYGYIDDTREPVSQA
jgi:enamine deaminase RidA (YjgF/YER057c/UK114 family)